MRKFETGLDTTALAFTGDAQSPVVSNNGYTNFGLNTDGGLTLANVATASLPAAPAEGTQFWDATLNKVVTWNGSSYERSSPSQGWKDLEMRVSNAATAAAAPTLQAFGPSGNIKQLAFAVNDAVYLEGHVPHDIKLGSTVYPHVHWTTNGTSTAVVKWQVSLITAPGHNRGNYGEDVPYTVEEAAHGTAWRAMVTEHPTGFTAPEIDSLVIIELKRLTNGGAENGDRVFANFVDLHYEIGQIATPSRVPDFFS